MVTDHDGLQPEGRLKPNGLRAVRGVHDEQVSGNDLRIQLAVEIESGYKSIKRFMAAPTSKSCVLRFFYFAFVCLRTQRGVLSIYSFKLNRLASTSARQQ